MIPGKLRHGNAKGSHPPRTGLRVAPRAAAWFATTDRAVVLHHGRSALYLENPEREVVGLVTPAVGAGPLFLTLADEGALFRFLHDPPVARGTVGRGPWVAVAPHGISWLDGPEDRARSLGVETLPLSIEGALHWSPRPRWPAPSASDWALVSSWARPEISPALVAPFEALARNWRRDPALAAEAGLDLAGRGSGLTPAGDDLLMGFALGLWATGDPSRDRLGELVAGASRRTTRLSAAYLAAAAEGEAPEAWHRLVDALTASPRNLDTHRAAILDWGASSGRHTLHAFLATLALGLDAPSVPVDPDHRPTLLPTELSA